MADLLKGKTCLVTGASRGIGKAIAERYAEEGGIVYAACKTQGALDDWADRTGRNVSGSVFPLYFDLRETGEIKEAILKINKERSRLDVVVNNAGLVQNELLGMISDESLLELFSVNVFAMLQVCQFSARIMCRREAGSIINISSIVGVEGSKGQIAYSASKGAVIAMTKSLSKELASKNVRVNSIAPGMTDTERIRVTVKQRYKGNVPPIGMGRLATPRDIADGCVYFGSDASEYVTGQVLVIGGGISTLERDFFNITFG